MNIQPRPSSLPEFDITILRGSHAMAWRDLGAVTIGHFGNMPVGGGSILEQGGPHRAVMPLLLANLTARSAVVP